MLIYGRSKCPLKAKSYALHNSARGPRVGVRVAAQPRRHNHMEPRVPRRVTIDMLPDVALLEIFGFYVNEGESIQKWHTLVHVCRKWRNIVFTSPRRLDLRLVCKDGTPVRDRIGVWPPLPIVIWHDYYPACRKWRNNGSSTPRRQDPRLVCTDRKLAQVRKTLDIWPSLPIVIQHDHYPTSGVDSIIAALEHNDRVCEIRLGPIPSSQWEEVFAAAMQVSFPALTHLVLGIEDEAAPVDPDSFLGGAAPRLQTLFLDCVPFPGLPKLLLSAPHLVHLNLWRIPHSGYIPPETMANCLSVLTRLESLFIGFKSPRSHSDWKYRRLPPPTRTLLPVLTELWFKGASGYLEDLVAQIDTPVLDKLAITFFHELIFDTPQLTQFISRTPKFRAHDEARVFFNDQHALVTLPRILDEALELAISCSQPDWQLSSLAQVCNSFFPQALIPAVEHLYICDGKNSQRLWQVDIENSQWLELLQPFTAVKSLYLSREFAPHIAPALQELVGERVTEVLPALQNLYLEEELHPWGPVQEAISQFYCARLFSSRHVVVSRWERKK